MGSANSRIVGALALASRGTIVFAVRERPLDAIRSYRDVLRRTGWDDRARERGVGFQHPQVSYSGTFCQDDDRSISMTPAEGDGGTTYLRVFYHETKGRSVCSDSRNDDFPRRRGPTPTLYPPNDAEVLDAHGGGGMNFSESSARLKTELGSAQLVAHYAAQLRADGWTPTTEAAGKEIAGQTWRIEDRKGTPWVGVLMAFDLPNADGREVLFRVMPPKPERYR